MLKIESQSTTQVTSLHVMNTIQVSKSKF